MHVHANASSPAHGWDKSPAQQARNTYNLEPGTGFGRIVSQISRGIYDPSSATDPLANGDSSGGTGTAVSDPTGGSGGSQSTTSQDGNTSTAQTQTSNTVDVSV
jgi:hypothetical protein